MGLINRFMERFARARAPSRGAALEARGQLQEAYELYHATGQGGDAARVMLARAQSEPDPRKRLALLALAVSCAPEPSEISREALTRHGLLALDLLRSNPQSLMVSERAQLAAQLESIGKLLEAAEVFGTLGDVDNQSRLLAACGAIDELETAFSNDEKLRNAHRARELTYGSARDLQAVGRRVPALRACEKWLVQHPDDEDIEALARRIRQQLVVGSAVSARLHGERVTLALGKEVVVGRDQGAISLNAPVLSRKHLVIRSGPRGPEVYDPGSRNGTLLAGARIACNLPIGQGLQLSLGGEIPCRIEPWGNGGAKLSIAGQDFIAPLGPLHLARWTISPTTESVCLTCDISVTPPLLNGIVSSPPIDLALGDELRAVREGPVLLQVLQP
jgi:hypothetical protein